MRTKKQNPIIRKKEELVLAFETVEYIFSSKKDKGGNPYLDHVMHVFSKCIRHFDDYDFNLQIVALLHDVIEDSYYTKERLQSFFDIEIVDAVVALTHKKGDSYDDYIDNLLRNRFATIVKKYDLEHNMDLSRLKEITEKDLERVEKYKKAYKKVMAKLSAMDEADASEYMTTDQLNYKLIVLNDFTSIWHIPNFATMFLEKLKDELNEISLKKVYRHLINWNTQKELAGLNHPTKIGTYKDFKFDIRYDYDGDAILPENFKPECGAILNIYIMDANIKQLRANSINDCIVFSERFLEDFIKKYNIKIG